MITGFKDFFKLTERKTDVWTEFLAGITTFLAMAYIINDCLKLQHQYGLGTWFSAR